MRLSEYIIQSDSSKLLEDMQQDVYRMEDYRSLTVPADVIGAFTELGNAQRGAPERAMLRVQQINGGGVLCPVVEHAGDLTHRMTHHARYGSLYPDIIQDKTAKVLKYLTSPYGFIREHAENMRANAAYRRKDLTEHVNEVNSALVEYAQEHSKLIVYNKPQYMAKYAAVSIGQQEWDNAIWSLEWLLRLSSNQTEFYIEAGKVYRNTKGEIVSFPYA